MDAILDGERVLAGEITESHRFVGMWRPPTDPIMAAVVENLARPASERWEVFICRCGSHLHYQDTNHEHWKRGCFDLPQYISQKK